MAELRVNVVRLAVALAPLAGCLAGPAVPLDAEENNSLPPAVVASLGACRTVDTMAWLPGVSKSDDWPDGSDQFGSDPAGGLIGTYHAMLLCPGGGMAFEGQRVHPPPEDTSGANRHFSVSQILVSHDQLRDALAIDFPAVFDVQSWEFTSNLDSWTARFDGDPRFGRFEGLGPTSEPAGEWAGLSRLWFRVGDRWALLDLELAPGPDTPLRTTGGILSHSGDDHGGVAAAGAIVAPIYTNPQVTLAYWGIGDLAPPPLE